MLTEHKSFLMIVCLLLSIIFLMGCFAGPKHVIEVASDNREQLPVKTITISIDKSQRPMLFDQLHKFADKHGFNYTFTDYATKGENFLVEMLRTDIKILALDVPNTSDRVSISLYDQSLATPVTEETLKNLDNLVVDLKSYISDIPNVTITEEK